MTKCLHCGITIKIVNTCTKIEFMYDLLFGRNTHDNDNDKDK